MVHSDYQKLINDLQSKIRILKDWKINYVDDAEYKAQISIDITTKIADLYDWGKEDIPKDYFIHEMLHCALREFNSLDRRKGIELRNKEEELVQDICMILYPDKEK